MLHLPLSSLTLSGLKKKVEGRLEQILINLPIGQEYKPNGIKDLKTLRSARLLDLIVLREPYTSNLIPNEFYRHCTDYFNTVLSSQNPGDYLAIVKDGRIMMDTGSNMAVIASDGSLIRELCFQWNRGLVSVEQNAFLKQKGFTRPTKINGTVFSMLAGGGAITYYYHWMVDSLPRLFLLREAGLFDKVDYFLVPNYSMDYHKETLSYFGIKSNRVISALSHRHVQADSLILTSYTRLDGHHPQWVCDGLHNTFASPSAPERSDRLLYISRADAKQRRVLNEPELIEVLKPYGFEVYTMSALSMREKAELLGSARVIVGPHGSGSANFAFCKPGTKILDLFPDNCVAPFICDICDKRGLVYDYLLCDSDGNATNAVEGQKLNLTVDVKRVEEKVKRLL
ncbi:MAG: glycosyltransferase family 61 protein [Bacteroidota bacterium]|jgi:hypothetical protein|nr:MAG: hypothetical protein DIU61_08125 [Bacteroidota bacterium]